MLHEHRPIHLDVLFLPLYQRAPGQGMELMDQRGKLLSGIGVFKSEEIY